MKKVLMVGGAVAGIALLLDLLVLIVAWRPMAALTSRVLTNKAAALVTRNQKAAAFRLFNAALTLNPANADAHARRAYVEIDFGDAAGALRDGEQAVALDDHHSLSWGAQGLAHEHLGDLKEAQTDYDHAILLDGRVASYYWHRGWISTHLNNLAPAFSDLNKAIQMKPEAWTPYDDRAQLEFKADEQNASESDLERAIMLAPEEAAPYAHRAYLRILQSRFDEAIVDANRAFHLRPTYGYALFLRAVAERRAGKPEVAVKTLNEISKADPKFKEIFLERGVAYYDAGESDSARRDFETTAQGNDKPSATVWIWMLDVEEGRHDEALTQVAALKGMATADDPWPTYFAEMLEGHATPDRLQMEANSLKIPIWRKDLACQIWFMAGKMAEGSGNHSLARADFQKAIDSKATGTAFFHEAQCEMAGVQAFSSKK